MTVYRYFIKIAFKNRGIILMYTSIFFFLTIMMGSGGEDIETRFMASSLIIGIEDNSDTEVSKGLKEYLSSKNYIVEIGDAIYEDDIRENIFLGKMDAAVIIPEDFEGNVIQKREALAIYSDDRKPETIQVRNQVNKYLTFLNATYENGEFDFNRLSKALEEEVEVSMLESQAADNSGSNPWFRQYFNFMSYVITAIYIGTMGFVMSDFREEKIESRIKVSSIRFSNFNRDIYLGQLTVAIIITSVFILGAVVLRFKDLGEVDLSKYIINTVVFSFSILSLTYLVNNLTRNRFIKNGLSNVLSLGTSFISGVFISQEFLGETVLTIAKFFPTYYFVRINDKKVNSFGDMDYEIAMQLVFAVVFFVVGLYFSKKNSKSS